MDTTTIKLRNKPESSGDSGFKFAITLITACVSVIFLIYNYAENTRIQFSSFHHLILSGLISLSIILLLYLGTYIFFKGMSLETKDPKNKEEYENIATEFYIDAFKVAFLLIFLMIFDPIWRLPSNYGVLASCILSSYIITFRLDVFKPLIMEFDPKNIEPNPQIMKLNPLMMKFKSLELGKYVELKYKRLTMNLSIFIFILKLLIMVQIFRTMWGWDKWQINSPIFATVCLLALYFYIAHFKIFKPLNLALYFKFKSFMPFMIIGLFFTLLIHPTIFSGHLAVVMDSVYYKQDKQIPIEISVTGLHYDGLFVDLFQTGSKVPIASLNMQSDSTDIYKDNSSLIMIGKYLGLGKYKVFIDCSNLTEGYYELSTISGNNYSTRFAKLSPLDSYLHVNERATNIFYVSETNRTFSFDYTKYKNDKG